MTLRPIRRALLSVHDKTGLVELARALAAHGVELISTGGTAQALRAAGRAVTEVSEITGAPEILDGRVKTLHPAVHGGILARRDDAHDIAHPRAAPDPRRSTSWSSTSTRSRTPWPAALTPPGCIEQIDIGGPAMIRAAAKNHDSVAVLIDPADYPALARPWIRKGAPTSPCAAASPPRPSPAPPPTTPPSPPGSRARPATASPTASRFAGTLRQRLRYGENPHQAAAFYTSGAAPGPRHRHPRSRARSSPTTTSPTPTAALALVAELADPAVAIIKHANPCGVGTGQTAIEAYARALACDPISAFGGIVACNRPLDAKAAEAITALFTEVVIAPAADEAAQAVFAKKPNLRLLLLHHMPDPCTPALELRTIAGGFLAQERDTATLDERDLRCVTTREPTAGRAARPALRLDGRQARPVQRHRARPRRRHRRHRRRPDEPRRRRRPRRPQGQANAGPGRAVLASDAFFPFPDGLEAASAAGVTAAIQPGGSVRDEEVIAAANAAGIAMLFTGQRHFRH